MSIGIMKPTAHARAPKTTATAMTAATPLDDVRRLLAIRGPLHRGVQVVHGDEERPALAGRATGLQATPVDPVHDGAGRRTVADVLSRLLGGQGLTRLRHCIPLLTVFHPTIHPHRPIDQAAGTPPRAGVSGRCRGA